MSSSNTFDHLTEYIERRMTADGIPGLSLAITDRNAIVHASAHGSRNLDAKIPVALDTQFQFGSIGKSFTAIVLLQLQEEGRIDLQAPLTEYLPWFQIRSAFSPIKLHHLVSHSAGITCALDATPESTFQAWSLREGEATAEPGAYFHYSNLGYKILGVVIEAITGKPYPESVRERILEPMGLRNTSPAITLAIRDKLAVGYTPYFDDRPWLPHHPLSPATWFETDTADGCLTANASDLAAYFRMLLNGGEISGGRILSPESFSLMTQRAVKLNNDPESDLHYGYGLFTFTEDGHRYLGHGGGMVGYISGMVGDADAGLGAVVLANGPVDSPAIARTALAYARSVLAGDPMPELTIDDSNPPVEHPDEYAGTFRDGDSCMTFASRGQRVALIDGDEAIELVHLGNDAFLADRPDLNRFAITFGREDGHVAEVAHGPRWFRADAYSGPSEVSTPDVWLSYPGRYRSHNPWITNFAVILRKGKLHIIDPTEHDSNDSDEALVPLADGWFRIGSDERGPERIRFDTIIGGKARRCVRSGCEFFRVGEP